MRVCVDTTILLDILKDEFRSFQDKLYTALARKENLVAPAMVLAELMPQFKGNNKHLVEFLDDHKIVIEESVEKCQEIEVAVLGNTHEDIKVSLPGRVVPGADFYDYNDKYHAGKTQYELPANLSEEKTQEIQLMAKEIYGHAGCSGFARVDFLLNAEGDVFINEINTIPGFTSQSMYTKLWEISGLSYQDLITKLIQLGLQK